MTERTDLTSYRLLGRSGLKISPPALGAMTFGKDWGWGAEGKRVRHSPNSSGLQNVICNPGRCRRH
jgi:hypothetical protein